MKFPCQCCVTITTNVLMDPLPPSACSHIQPLHNFEKGMKIKIPYKHIITIILCCKLHLYSVVCPHLVAVFFCSDDM